MLALARATAEVSHNHPEGVRGAQAIAAAIWWALRGADQPTLRKNLAQFGYDLRPTVAEMAADFGFTTLAEETVPIALICALEATSWDDAIRKAVEVGGDSDTIACMAGGIAEAMFGFPACHATATFEALPADMAAVMTRLYVRAGLDLPTLDTNQTQPQPWEAPSRPSPIPEPTQSLWSWLKGLFG